MPSTTTQARNSRKAVRLLERHPGLADALEADHHISRDLKDRLYRYGKLSVKQIDLAFKLVKQGEERAERIEQRKQEAASMDPLPEGRYAIEGTLLKVTWRDSSFGGAVKALLTTKDGHRVWGTVPSSLLGWANDHIDSVMEADNDHVMRLHKAAREEAIRKTKGQEDIWVKAAMNDAYEQVAFDNPYYTRPSIYDVLKGHLVRFTAKVQRSNDDHTFGFWSRPTQATVLAGPSPA